MVAWDQDGGISGGRKEIVVSMNAQSIVLCGDEIVLYLDCTLVVILYHSFARCSTLDKGYMTFICIISCSI